MRRMKINALRPFESARIHAPGSRRFAAEPADSYIAPAPSGESAMDACRQWSRLLVAVCLALLLSSCGYNQLRGLDQEVKATWAELQDHYQRRADLVSVMTTTVEKAVKFDHETLQRVIAAGSQASSIWLDAEALSYPETFRSFENAQRHLTGALSRFMAVAEQYPQLKNHEGYRDVQARLEAMEKHIADTRKRYSESVSKYNDAVRFFPTNLTARYLLGLRTRESFRADEGPAKPPEV